MKSNQDNKSNHCSCVGRDLFGSFFVGLWLTLLPLGGVSGELQRSPSSETPVIVKKREDKAPDVQRTSSRENRQGKTHIITAQPVGSNFVPAYSFGVSYGIALDPDWVLQLELSRSRATYGEILSSNSEERNTSGLGVNAKHFVGNSLYVTGGLDYQRFDYKFTGREYWLSFGGVNHDLALSGSGSLLSASIRLGNQWQWSYFTLGCDWIGLNVPLVTDLNAESDANPEIAQSRKQEFKDRNAAMWEKVSAQAVRLYLGASF